MCESGKRVAASTIPQEVRKLRKYVKIREMSRCRPRGSEEVDKMCVN